MTDEPKNLEYKINCFVLTRLVTINIVVGVISDNNSGLNSEY